MEYCKFIISGEDKKVLSHVKNALVSNGHSFIGYTSNAANLLRHIRSCMPDFVVVEIRNNFRELRQTLQVIDEELLSACILIMDIHQDEVFDFIRHSRVMTYVAEPVFEESLVQIVDLSVINYRRVIEYENQVKKLNETLESRKLMEKAKWLLVEQEGLTEAEAYEIIRKKSRDNRMPMKEIAGAIILTRG